jgi:hypothetical protein
MTYATYTITAAVVQGDDPINPLYRPDRCVTVNSESNGCNSGLPGALAVVQLLEVRTIDRLHSPYTTSAHLRSKEH